MEFIKDEALTMMVGGMRDNITWAGKIPNGTPLTSAIATLTAVSNQPLCSEMDRDYAVSALVSYSIAVSQVLGYLNEALTTEETQLLYENDGEGGIRNTKKFSEAIDNVEVFTHCVGRYDDEPQPCKKDK